MPKTKGPKTQIISLHVPVEALQLMDELVRRRIFMNRSAFIRHAIEDELAKWAPILSKPQEKHEEEGEDFEVLKGR